jgi:3-hydroxybutyryl-CoA dehydrogenase
MGGMRTLLFDAADGAAEAGKCAITARLERLVEKEQLSGGDAGQMISLLEVARQVEGVAPADVVIEAVYEDIEVKQVLFREVEACVSADCILATNTSSIPVAKIASVCKHKHRVAGMHFFNPVPLMKLVEVIRTTETDEGVASALAKLGERMGRTPVQVKDAPGFLVNMGGRAYATESLRIAHDGIATPAQIDAIMRECCGFRMGPFELMDLTGTDVNYPVTKIIYEGYMEDPRLRTSPLHEAMFNAGLFGRKTGQGYYRYDDKGHMIDPPSPDYQCNGVSAGHVVLGVSDKQLEQFCADVGIEIASEDDGSMPVLVSLLGEDCTHFASRTDTDPGRLVAVDLTCDTSTRVTLMTAPGARAAAQDVVASTIIRSGRKVTAVKDSPGFVSQRMVAMVANLGCYMAEIGLAKPDEIDLAMRLGLNFPQGPLQMAEDFGLAEMTTVLEQLQAITGDDRYRPTLWLKRRGALGLDIRTPA